MCRCTAAWSHNVHALASMTPRQTSTEASVHDVCTGTVVKMSVQGLGDDNKGGTPAGTASLRPCTTQCLPCATPVDAVATAVPA